MSRLPAESDSRVVGGVAVLHGFVCSFLGEVLSKGAVRRELELAMARLPGERREEVADGVQALWAAGVTWRVAGNRGSSEGQASARQGRSRREGRMASPSPLSAQEAAAVLNVSDRRVRQLAAEGRLPACKGRRGLEFDAVAVEAERKRRERAA